MDSFHILKPFVISLAVKVMSMVGRRCSLGFCQECDCGGGVVLGGGLLDLVGFGISVFAKGFDEVGLCEWSAVGLAKVCNISFDEKSGDFVWVEYGGVGSFWFFRVVWYTDVCDCSFVGFASDDLEFAVYTVGCFGGLEVFQDFGLFVVVALSPVVCAVFEMLCAEVACFSFALSEVFGCCFDLFVDFLVGRFVCRGFFPVYPFDYLVALV